MQVVISKKAKEVVFDTVDGLGNKHIIHFKKENDGYFVISTHGHSYKNWCIPVDKLTLTWAADAGQWEEISVYINQGVEKVYNIRSR